MTTSRSTRSVLVLGVTILVVWGALAVPAWRALGVGALWQSLAALTVCLIPAAITLCLGLRALQRSPGEQLTTMLAGMGVRMAMVLGAGSLLYWRVPELNDPPRGLWVWLIVFYLATLVVEMRLLLRARAAAVEKS